MLPCSLLMYQPTASWCTKSCITMRQRLHYFINVLLDISSTFPMWQEGGQKGEGRSIEWPPTTRCVLPQTRSENNESCRWFALTVILDLSPSLTRLATSPSRWPNHSWSNWVASCFHPFCTNMIHQQGWEQQWNALEMSLREHLPKKKCFLSGIARMRGGGGAPARILLTFFYHVLVTKIGNL